MPQRLSKRVGGSSRFFKVPMDREIAISCTNDCPLILAKPAFPTSAKFSYPVSAAGTLSPGQSWYTAGSQLTNESGPSDTHFRITPDLRCVMNQIQPYLQLYKECFIAGVTVKIKPTWNRKILNEGLKVTSMIHEQLQDTIPRTNGIDYTINEQRPVTGTSTCRIPYGQYPSLYYRKLPYAEATDPHTIMCNKSIAQVKGAKYLSLADGTTQTFRIVPQVYTESMTADGKKIQHPRNAGWFPVDSIMDRKFGGMEFCIDQFPNFDGPQLDPTDSENSIVDVNNETTWPTVPDTLANLTQNPDLIDVPDSLGCMIGPGQELSSTEVYQIQGGDIQEREHVGSFFTFNDSKRKQLTKSRANDGIEYNEHYVIVNRTYHIKFRGRKVFGKHSDWGEYDLKPTDLDLVPQYYDFATAMKTAVPGLDSEKVVSLNRDHSLKPMQYWLKKQLPQHTPDIGQSGFQDIAMCPLPNQNQGGGWRGFDLTDHIDDDKPTPSIPNPLFKTIPFNRGKDDPFNPYKANAPAIEGTSGTMGGGGYSTEQSRKRARGTEEETNQFLDKNSATLQEEQQGISAIPQG